MSNNKLNELDDLYEETEIRGTVISTRTSWAGHVWRSEGLIGQTTKPNTRRPGGVDLDKDGQTECRKI